MGTDSNMNFWMMYIEILRSRLEIGVKLYLIVLLSMLYFTASAQAPANDLCQTATSLGTPSINQQVCTTGGTTVNANPEYPYIALTGCSGPSSTAPTSAADVWYTITTPANANQLEIDLTSTMTGTSIAVFSGVCGSLQIAACSGDNSSGNLIDTLAPVNQNATYYIRVSGISDNDQAPFTLCVTPSHNNSACVTQSNFTVTPQPSNGVYYPGDVVDFCYTVTQFTQISANWFEGIQIDYGPAWDPSSFTVVSVPTSCAGNGVWAYYSSFVGNNGTTFGPGFFYDSPSGSPTGTLDGNPGNNFGDNCINYNWTFCWQMTVAQPAPGSCTGGNPALDLTIVINQFGDSETGGWGSPACSNDPAVNFPVFVSCCEQPTFSITDVSCGSGCSGAITATGQGTPPFTYNWSTGNSTNTISNICAGPYNITVTDSTGCQVISTAVVQNTGSLGTTNGSTDASCYGMSDGKAWVTPTNGSGPYTYAWNTSPVQTTDTAFNLAPGNYQVIASDAGGCVDTVDYVIAQPNPLRGTLFSSPTGCGTQPTGMAWSITSGGTAPYTFAWSTSPTQTNDTAFNLAAGSYTITAMDANGCSFSRSVTVGSSAGLSSTTGFDSTCLGSATGKAWAAGNGGTQPYSFTWSTTPAQNTDTASNLGAGSYTVTITDASGCSTTNSVTVLSASAVSLATWADSTSCSGGSDGKAWVSASGGGPFSYIWNTTPSQNTDTAFNLAAGNYTVTVTDGNGCTTASTVTLFDAVPVNITMFADSIGCFGANNANVWAVVSGGHAPYTYNWSSGTAVPTGDTITNVSAGSYSLTITDANGCMDTASINVLQQANLNLSGGTDSASCTGVADGSAWVQASGGAPPYTYVWGGTSPIQTTDTATGLRANVYMVTVTDNNGCQDFLQLSVGEPLSIQHTMDFDSVACSGTTTGRAWITASGGIGSYTYAWSGSGVMGQTPDTLTQLAAGVYVVTVTDGINCSVADSIEVFEPAVLSATAVPDSVNCNGGSSGSIVASAIGGTPPYSYNWSGGNVSPAGNSVTGLVAGSYSVTVNDSKNCQFMINGIDVGEPPALNLSAVVDSVSCAGGSDGSIDLTVTGGTAPYSYFWTFGAINEDVNGLQAGTYDVIVTDAKGCTDSLPGIQIFEPAALSVTTGTDSVGCSGAADGRIYVGVSGGTAPYTYVWSTVPVQNSDTASGLTSGTYTVSVFDANGCSITGTNTIGQVGGITLQTGFTDVSCNGGADGKAWVTASGGAGGFTYSWNTTPVQTSDTASGLQAVSYIVVVVDANNCQNTETITISEPTALSLSSSAVDVSCNGNADGSATVTASGGTSGYTYNWSATGSNGSTNASITGMGAGTFSVTVSDANACADSATNIVIAEPAALSLSITSTDATCFGAADGTIDLTVSGGTPGYTYSWTNNLSGQDPTGVAAGSYRVTVTDNHGCSDTISTVIDEPAGMTITGQVSNVSCFGQTDGAVDITVSGGTPPYQFSWTNTVVGNTEDLSGLGANTYDVTVTDSNSCSQTKSFTVLEPDSLGTSISLSLANFSCSNNVVTGTVNQTVSGGVPPYTYLWSSGDVTQNTTNVNVADFQVTVTDDNGCTAESQVVQNPLTPLVADIVVDSAACYGDDNGQAEVFVMGGVEPYMYDWTGLPNPVVGRRALDLPAGNYSVLITDSLGCDTTINFTVTEQPLMTVDGGDDITVPFNEDSVLNATTAGVRPTDNITYTWTPDEGLSCTDCNDPVVTPERSLTYTVTVDVNGCVYSDTVRVEVGPPTVVFYAPNAFSPNGDNINDVYYIYAKGVKAIYWSVFNRWGDQVFTSRSLDDGWDGTFHGKAANQGVYVLHVFVQYYDRTSKRISQSIMLLR